MLTDEVREQMKLEGRIKPTADDYRHSRMKRSVNCAYLFKYDCRGCGYSFDPERFDGGCKRDSPPPDGRIPWSAEGQPPAENNI